MNQPFYLTKYSGQQLDWLEENLRVVVGETSPKLATWLIFEIHGERLRRRRNSGRRIPREPTPLFPPVHQWSGRHLATALRAVVFATGIVRHPDWGPLFDAILPYVIVECETRLRGKSVPTAARL